MVCAFTLCAHMGFAQTPTDGIFMEKGQICAAALYNHDSWDEYWEGALLRTNGNIGTITTQSVMLMATVGVLNDNFNVIVGAPYIWTEASAGTLSGQHGIQDLGIWAKYRLHLHDIGKGTLSFIPEAGFSTPLTDYNNDILPLSIGFGGLAGSLHGMLNYYHPKGPYVNLNWGYTWRKNIDLDRTFYYSDGPHYTSEVAMSDVIDYAASIGFFNSHLKVEATYAQMITQGGSDIRRQDGPFIGNRMIAGRAYAIVQYYLSKPKGLSVIVNGGQVFTGANVGKATSYGGGIAYQFGYLRKSTPE